MEKARRSKAHKILSFLPKASSVSFHSNQPFGSGAANPSKFKAILNGSSRGFLGPNISMIPAEARRIKSKSGTTRRSDDDQEPTSPKISCMGQIKHNNNSVTVMSLPPQEKKKKNNKRETSKPAGSLSSSSSIRKLMFGGKKSGAHVPNIKNMEDTAAGIDRAPGLSQMKRFTSSRDNKLNSDFDWKYYSEEEDQFSSMPHSAPMSVGADREPRKEINLWKRRTMEPPKALHLNGIPKPFQSTKF